ncbi:small integral membrane protein 24 [Gouania willdenowi]|uniref:small integral membrane protein 24 n=1 Tax=Gouania willdenowi TaxID=441366 RepID=UPI0010554097|nr:small integral membrane protein 24 [Gouania willdenowi]
MFFSGVHSCRMKALVLAVLLSVSDCWATKGLRAAAGAKAGTLQPWLVGLTAVVGFLLIVFVILIIHRLLKNKREEEEGWAYEKSEDPNEDHFRQTNL